MRPENAAAALLDNSLEARGVLSHPSRGVPIFRRFVRYANAEAFFAGFRLKHADPGNWWDCESDARHPEIIRLLLVAVQHICRDDLRIVAGDRCQQRPAFGSVAGGIDGLVGGALEEFVELELALVALHAGGRKIQCIEIRHAAGGMHDQVGLVTLVLVVRSGANRETSGILLDRLDPGSRLDIDADLARFRQRTKSLRDSS